MTSGQGLIISRSQLGSSNGQTVRVYYADANNPGVELGYFVPLELELNYTSIGTCAGGRMASTDIGGFQPYYFVLGVEVFHDGFWDRIFLCTHTGAVFNGEYWTVDLVSLWDVVRDGFVPEDTVFVDYPQIGFVALNSIQAPGSPQPGTPISTNVKIGYGMTWAGYYRQKYFNKDDDYQWGYDANGTFLAGNPLFFTAASYTADRRMIEKNDQGYPDLDYVTAYKGFNADLPTLNTFEGDRTSSVNVLVPRRAQVVSWDGSKADDTYLYRYTQQDPPPEGWLQVDPFPVNQTIDDGQYFTVEFGSYAATHTIAVRVNLKVPEILNYYDDLTKIEILIKFSGVENYEGTTFVTSVAGFMGSNPRTYPGIFRQFGLYWTFNEFKSQVYDEETGEGLRNYYFLTRPVNAVNIQTDVTGIYAFPYSTTLGNLFGIKREFTLAELRKIWTEFASGSFVVLNESYDITPFQEDLNATFGVAMGFDEYADDGAQIVAGVEVSFTGRRISDGWVEPPGFNSEIHGDTAYRMLIDGIFVPPVNITTPNGTFPVAGSTVRFSPAVGAQSEILTGILPNRRRDD